MSGFQQGLVEVAASLRVELERLEGQMSLGEDVNIDLYARAVGHYRRVCETLGIERRAKDITPTLDQYLVQQTESPA